jgi:hypothetical protein
MVAVCGTPSCRSLWLPRDMAVEWPGRGIFLKVENATSAFLATCCFALISHCLGSVMALPRFPVLMRRFLEPFCCSCQISSPARWPKTPWTRGSAPPGIVDPGRAPVHQAQPHHPARRTRVGGAAPPGGRRRASRRLDSVRTPVGGWGRLGASSWPQIRRAWDRRRCALLTDFWAAGRARNPLDFVRWVVPIKARGRYTLCSAIHRARRRCPAGA